MENGAAMFASMKMVDSRLVLLKREFAIMHVLEKESNMLSSDGRSCSDCSAG